MDRYGLPNDYVTNPEVTVSTAPGQIYWTPRRIALSGLYQSHVYRWAAELVSRQALRRVLDVGCGPATKLNRMIAPLAETVVGVDQASAIEYCQKTHQHGAYFVDDFAHPTFEDREPFDLIICCDVVEHLEDPDSLLGYLRSFGNSSSLYLISTPAREKLRGENVRFSANPAHVREWSTNEFLWYLAQHGFVVRESRLLPPIAVWPPSLVSLRLALRQLPVGKHWRHNHAVLCTLKN